MQRDSVTSLPGPGERSFTPESRGPWDDGAGPQERPAARLTHRPLLARAAGLTLSAPSLPFSLWGPETRGPAGPRACSALGPGAGTAGPRGLSFTCGPGRSSSARPRGRRAARPRDLEVFQAAAKRAREFAASVALLPRPLTPDGEGPGRPAGGELRCGAPGRAESFTAGSFSHFHGVPVFPQYQRDLRLFMHTDRVSGAPRPGAGVPASPRRSPARAAAGRDPAEGRPAGDGQGGFPLPSAAPEGEGRAAATSGLALYSARGHPPGGGPGGPAGERGGNRPEAELELSLTLSEL